MTETIKTKSFELAILASGNRNARKLALLLPGRLDTKDYACFPSHADYLAEYGFYAVAFDPPGTWESSGGINLYTTTNYIKAVGELIEYFNNKPTLLMGHSRGAAVSIFASVNLAVVGIVPIMANFGEPTAPGEEAMQKGYKLSYRDLPPGTSKTKEQKEFKLPAAYWEDGKQYNAGEILKICRKPKLLIYGDKDEFTPVDVAKKLFEEAPAPKMIKEIHSTHDYRYSPEAIEEVNKELGKFLDKYFK
ncbi:MAG: alpha/beta hydrolase [Patescibacteria group bacterium]|nr:alpha/beta hydrolase [Patescibacteria group bacterium]MCL5431997.1 alpha/beta hydrolase [Patescibacteria group bacterium]